MEEKKNDMKTFRITWRHEAYIQAESHKEALEKWAGAKLGEMDKEVENGTIDGHSFVEHVSFEDEDYNELSFIASIPPLER